MLSPATFQARGDLVERLRRMIVGGNAAGLAAAARGLADRPDFTALLPRIDCPVLLVVGKHDAISTPAEMAAMAGAIPGPVGRDRGRRPRRWRSRRKWIGPSRSFSPPPDSGLWSWLGAMPTSGSSVGMLTQA